MQSKPLFTNFALICICSVIFLGCIPKEECFIKESGNKGDLNYPNYIIRLYPQPNTEVATNYFYETFNRIENTSRGINIAFSVANLFPNINEFTDTSKQYFYKLIIDKEIISNKTLNADERGELVIRDDQGRALLKGVPEMLVLSWTPELKSGSHSAEIQVIRPSGENLSFKWCFKLTD